MNEKSNFEKRRPGTFLRAVAMIFFLGGPLLGLLAGILVRGQEDRDADNSLGDYVAERAAVLKRETFAITEALYHIRAFFQSSTTVSRDQFRIFTEALLSRHPIIARVEWIPYVTESKRAEHERRARAEGLEGYRIWARNPNREILTVPARIDYYPIYFIEPLAVVRRVLGFDLSYDKTRRSILELAVERNEVKLTDPINLTQESNPPRGFLALLPLFEERGAQTRQQSRTLRGVIGITIQARELLFHSLGVSQNDPSPEIYFELADEDSSGKPAVIASSSSGDPSARFLPQASSVLMELGGQRWRLSARPSQTFLDRHRTAKPFVLGAGVFLLWELLGGITLFLTNRFHNIALRDQSLVYESAVLSLREGVVVANTDGRFLLLNPSAREILGLGGQNAAVPNLPNTKGLFLPDTVTPFPPERLPLARALKGESVTEEIFLRNEALPNGIWLSSSGAPIRNEEGTLVGGVINFRDISEWKLASESLRQSVKELKDLKYAVDQASIVSITNLDGKILYCNEIFCQISGYSAGELLGQDHRLVNSGFHPPAFFQDLWTEIGAGSVWRGVMRNRAKSGHFFWVDTTIVPLLNEAGQCERYLALSKDVTFSQMQEQDLLLHSNAVEQTADVVFITDRDGVIGYVNPAFESITGFSRADALGKTPRILKSGSNDPPYYEELWRTILSGQSFRSTTINRKKNGGMFECEQTITPIKDSAGNITNFVSVIKDITDRVMRQRQEVEMKYAAQVQQQLYPALGLEIQGFDIAGTSYPAEFACGDYYDYLEARNGTLCLAIGDVSGHGMAPAMIMTATRSYLRFLVRSQSDLGQIMSAVNEVLYADLEKSRFVALLLVTIDLETRRLHYINAGLTSGYVLDKNGEVKAELSICGPPLGMLSDATYDSCRSVMLDCGDIVVLMTDGVSESRNQLDEFFEPEGALAVVRAHRRESAQQIVESLYHEVREFSAGAPQLDDITAIVCKVGGNNGIGRLT